MANETILVVDADTKSQKVLEVSFKKAGYRVLITDSLAEARRALAANEPDLIVSDTQLPDGDGFSFCEEVKHDPRLAGIPFVFLTEQRSLPEKMRGFELGADEYLTKPIYIKEVTSRVDVLLQKRAHERLSGGEAEEFHGRLASVTMIDLLQTIERELRSGSIQINRNGRKGAVYFREGNILDAMCGKLQGEEALYRLMLWPDGEFRVQYHDDVRRADHIEKNSDELLIEGISRLDKWNELVSTLPSLQRVFEADYQRLPELLEELPEEAGRVVRLFDGMRTLREVIDDSPFDDITTLQIIRRLLGEGVLLEMAGPDPGTTNSPTNLEAWLEGSDDEQHVPTPFTQVDSSVEVSSIGAPGTDELADDEQPSKEDGGGHWKVHWHEGDEPQGERDTLEEPRVDDALSELEQREARRREEEAKHLLRQSGRFEATIPQVKAVDVTEDVSDDDAQADAQSRRTTTPIGTVERDEESAPGDDEPEELFRQRRPTPIATPSGGLNAQRERSPADETSPGIQVARLFTTEEPDEDLVEEEAPTAGEAEAAAEAPQEPDEMRSSAERRAAAVEEAASVKREAARSVRESAPYPAVSAEDVIEDDDEAEASIDEVGGRQRRVTEEISSVEDDDAEQIAQTPGVALGKTADADVVEEAEPFEQAEPAVDPDELDTAELDRDDHRDIARDDAEAGEADDDLPEVAVEAPPKVERNSTDRQLVKAEFDLSQSPGSRPEKAVDEEAPDADDQVEEAEEAEADDQVDDAEAGEQPDEVEADDQVEEAKKPEADEAEADEAVEDASEPEADEAEADEAADDEDDVFQTAVSDHSHEESFFSDGEEGEYDWEFEDVPKSSNRWMYFTAVAVVVALTALILTLLPSDKTDKSVKEDTVAAATDQGADDSTAGADKAPDDQKADEQPKADDSAAKPVAEVAGLSAEEAPKVASDNAAAVHGTARMTALVLAGLDPRMVGDSADAGSDAAAAPGVADQIADAGTPQAAPDKAVAANDAKANAAPTKTAPDKAGAAKPPAHPSKPKPKAAKPAGDSFEARLSKAEHLVHRGHNSQALSLLRKLSAEKAGNGKVAYLHGTAALGAGNNSEAIKQLSRADRLGFHKSSMYLDLATAYQLSGEVGKAKQAYKKFLKIQPSGKRADEVRSILKRL